MSKVCSKHKRLLEATLTLSTLLVCVLGTSPAQARLAALFPGQTHGSIKPKHAHATKSARARVLGVVLLGDSSTGFAKYVHVCEKLCWIVPHTHHPVFTRVF